MKEGEEEKEKKIHIPLPSRHQNPFIISLKIVYSNWLSCRSALAMLEPDEDDYWWTKVGGDLWIPFRMPETITGLIEVNLALQCIETRYSGSIEDNFGFSSVNLKGKSMIYLEEVRPSGQPPERRYATLLDYRKSSEVTWSFDIASPGEFVYAQLYSMHPYAPGQLVELKVGIYDEHYIMVNDMSFRYEMINRWFLSKVSIRASPPPSPS